MYKSDIVLEENAFKGLMNYGRIVEAKQKFVGSQYREKEKDGDKFKNFINQYDIGGRRKRAPRRPLTLLRLPPPPATTLSLPKVITMPPLQREITTKVLMEAINTSWDEIEAEVEELLKSYEIPPDYKGFVISEVKKKVRSKLEGLPNEEWLTDVLSKLYIRLAYELLHV